MKNTKPEQGPGDTPAKAESETPEAGAVGSGPGRAGDAQAHGNAMAVETSVTPTEASPADSVETLQARVETLENSVLRAKADYQNLQRRGTIERSEAIRFANADLMRSLVALIDDFERSLAASDQEDNIGVVKDGIRMMYENLMKSLREHGLETIEAVDQPFDPKIHEAMMQQPSAEKAPGTVLSEVAKGYRLRDRVIRPAKVVVSRAADGKDGAQP